MDIKTVFREQKEGLSWILRRFIVNKKMVYRGD